MPTTTLHYHSQPLLPVSTSCGVEGGRMETVRMEPYLKTLLQFPQAVVSSCADIDTRSSPAATLRN